MGVSCSPCWELKMPTERSGASAGGEVQSRAAAGLRLTAAWQEQRMIGVAQVAEHAHMLIWPLLSVSSSLHSAALDGWVQLM